MVPSRCGCWCLLTVPVADFFLCLSSAWISLSMRMCFNLPMQAAKCSSGCFVPRNWSVSSVMHPVCRVARLIDCGPIADYRTRGEGHDLGYVDFAAWLECQWHMATRLLAITSVNRPNGHAVVHLRSTTYNVPIVVTETGTQHICQMQKSSQYSNRAQGLRELCAMYSLAALAHFGIG